MWMVFVCRFAAFPRVLFISGVKALRYVYTNLSSHSFRISIYSGYFMSTQVFIRGRIWIAIGLGSSARPNKFRPTWDIITNCSIIPLKNYMDQMPAGTTSWLLPIISCIHGKRRFQFPGITSFTFHFRPESLLNSHINAAHLRAYMQAYLCLFLRLFCMGYSVLGRTCFVKSPKRIMPA